MEYNAIGLTKKIARGGSTLAEYSYLADGANALLLAFDGDYWGAIQSGLSLLPLGDLLKAPRIGKNIGILSDAVDAVKSVHGNSKASTNAQHLYEIFDKETGIVVKTGISGGKESKICKSYRATSQVNKWNKELGKDVFDSRIIEIFPAGEGARGKALNAEKAHAKELRAQGSLNDKNYHVYP